MSEIVKIYIRNMRTLFPVYQKMEKRFLKDFQINVQEYVGNYPECTMDNLINEFGAPKDIIYDYMSSMESEYYVTHIKKTKNIKFFIYLAASIIIMLFIVSMFFIFQVKQQAEDAIVTTEQTIIEYKN